MEFLQRWELPRVTSLLYCHVVTCRFGETDIFSRVTPVEVREQVHWKFRRQGAFSVGQQKSLFLTTLELTVRALLLHGITPRDPLHRHEIKSPRARSVRERGEDLSNAGLIDQRSTTGPNNKLSHEMRLGHRSDLACLSRHLDLLMRRSVEITSLRSVGHHGDTVAAEKV